MVFGEPRLARTRIHIAPRPATLSRIRKHPIYQDFADNPQ
jgi:hypothetical protein